MKEIQHDEFIGQKGEGGERNWAGSISNPYPII